MTSPRFRAATYLLIAASVLPGCQQETTEAKRKPIGHHTTRFSVHVGSIWGGGYSIDVAPEEYILVEHESCPAAKKLSSEKGKGFCVIRPTKEQSDRFAAAMERFRRNAVSLESVSVDDPWLRPDGKSCQNEVTDSTLVSLMWTGTEGVKVATFYFGCDPDEFENFYKSVLSVTDPLPVQDIIDKH